MINKVNLFEHLPQPGAEESFETFLELGGVRLERIVSHAHATPEGEWYDQHWDEWVLLLQGSAGLLIEGEPEPILLKPGDSLHLPSHLKHRVEWTDAEQPTIWLAVHVEILAM
ncbi:MAG: cupin domain-containing protein [Methylococcales bacterium]|nr:cupin domain-containing protein [Methylococcaceae bacterium]